MNKPMTLKELSGIVGYSSSTISKALSDSSEISETTKNIVKKAVIDHNYVPNILARSLKTKEINLLKVSLPQHTENSSQLLSEIAQHPGLKSFEEEIERTQTKRKVAPTIKGSITGIIVLVSDGSY